MSDSAMEFKKSEALTLGVELELQLLSQRDYDLTRAATDLLSHLKYDSRFGDVKLEITESMIEVSTLARASVDEIAADLEGLRKTLIDQCARNNIAICGGGTHPFHAWPERRICPSDRFDAVYQRYGYLAKQFTVFGQHVHVGCETADDAIWLTQALGPYVPIFIALSASSPTSMASIPSSSRRGSTRFRRSRSAASVRKSPTGRLSSNISIFSRPAASSAASRICIGISAPSPNSARSRSASATRRCRSKRRRRWPRSHNA